MITPDQFQAAATAWAGAVTVAIGAITLSVIKLAPTVKEAVDAIESLRKQNSNQQEQITSIALATVPQPPQQSPHPASTR